MWHWWYSLCRPCLHINVFMCKSFVPFYLATSTWILKNGTKRKMKQKRPPEWNISKMLWHVLMCKCKLTPVLYPFGIFNCHLHEEQFSCQSVKCCVKGTVSMCGWVNATITINEPAPFLWFPQFVELRIQCFYMMLLQSLGLIWDTDSRASPQEANSWVPSLKDTDLSISFKRHNTNCAAKE